MNYLTASVSQGQLFFVRGQISSEIIRNTVKKGKCWPKYQVLVLIEKFSTFTTTLNFGLPNSPLSENTPSEQQ